MNPKDATRVSQALSAIIAKSEMRVAQLGHQLSKLKNDQSDILTAPLTDDILQRAFEDRGRQARLRAIEASLIVVTSEHRKAVLELAKLRRQHDIVIQASLKAQKRAAQQRARRGL